MDRAGEDPRLLIVTSSWPRTGDEIAGTFVRTDALARARAGANVFVAAPRGPGDARACEGVTVVDVPHGGAFGSPGALARIVANPLRALGLLPWARAVLGMVAAIAPTRMVAHWILPAGLLACRCEVAHREVVAHGGDVRLLSRMPRGIARRIVELVCDHATLRAVSVELASRLVAIAPSVARRLVVAPMALDDEAIARARQARGPARAASTRPLHVVAARLVREKKIERAIDEARAHRAQLVIVGDGPDRARLSAHALRSSVEVVWTGALPHHEALAWIGRADLVLAPLATGEGAPTVIREAQALGVPSLVLA